MSDQKSRALMAVMNMMEGVVPGFTQARADYNTITNRGATAVLLDPDTGLLDAALSAIPETLACTVAAGNGSLYGMLLATLACTAKVVGQKYAGRLSSSSAPDNRPGMAEQFEKARTGMAAGPISTSDDLATPPPSAPGPSNAYKNKRRHHPYGRQRR